MEGGGEWKGMVEGGSTGEERRCTHTPTVVYEASWRGRNPTRNHPDDQPLPQQSQLQHLLSLTCVSLTLTPHASSFEMELSNSARSSCRSSACPPSVSTIPNSASIEK